jgi:hypothetical protein
VTKLNAFSLISYEYLYTSLVLWLSAFTDISLLYPTVLNLLWNMSYSLS